jgi:hypothetical protein
MKEFFYRILDAIQSEIQKIDIEDADISIEDALRMKNIVQNHLESMREYFINLSDININDEILFFREIKPKVLSFLIYFNKIYTIELKRPNGSNDIQRDYYRKELDCLTYFFDRNLDFYQYYRSNSVYLDEKYFVRGRIQSSLCTDSLHFIKDPQFSTGYDYKVSKILANEILKIYLNKKLQIIDKCFPITPVKNIEINTYKWSFTKSAAVELGYALYSSSVINNGNIDIREVMMLIENIFNLDLGDYYRTYITIKNRKKDRTVFLNTLIENMIRRMDQDDTL